MPTSFRNPEPALRQPGDLPRWRDKRQLDNFPLWPSYLGALIIGAYAPKWFMRGQCRVPDQAERVWPALGRPMTQPIQSGVFELAHHLLDEPPAALAHAMQSTVKSDSRLQPC